MTNAQLLRRVRVICGHAETAAAALRKLEKRIMVAEALREPDPDVEGLVKRAESRLLQACREMGVIPKR